MNTRYYKGYQIDDAQDGDQDNMNYLVYDGVLGDYLEHDTFYSVQDAMNFIDGLES